MGNSSEKVERVDDDVEILSLGNWFYGDVVY